MAEKYFSPPHIYSFCWPLTTGNDPDRPSWVRLNRLRTGLDCSAQQCTNGVGALGELQVRSRRANCRSHTSFLSSIPPSRKNTRFGSSRRWHRKLTSKNSAQHLMIQNRPKRKRIINNFLWTVVLRKLIICCFSKWLLDL